MDTGINGQSGDRAFPKLSDAQLHELENLAEVKSYPDGTYLFRAGDREVPFFVVRSGSVEILDESEGAEERLALMEERDIIGDLSTFESRSSNVSARARGTCEVYRISPENLQRLLSETSTLSDLILQAFITRHELLQETGYTGIRVIGSRYSSDMLRIREFLDRNQVIHTWIDLEENPEVHELLQRLHVTVEDTPVVLFGEQWLLRNPSDAELGERLGIRKPVNGAFYDLAVIGAGPAGLAAAVYAASEGLRTIVLERMAPGGQASASSKIENYLGFPTGLSGQELADRATLQAQKFGARLSAPAEVTSIGLEGPLPVLELGGNEHLTARTVLIATGAKYRALSVEGCERFFGAGVYYAATHTEAMMCEDEQLVVIGGGNSAGQAAVYLSKHARKVVLVIREDDLREDMSAYLADRIEQVNNIEVRTSSEVVDMTGAEHLETVEVRDNTTDATKELATPAVFCFIGATPRTGWLPEEILRDEEGFIQTGPAVEVEWTGERGPFYLETSVPGIFAAGDVRSGSVKRVASAVGEGAMMVQFAHEHLRERV